MEIDLTFDPISVAGSTVIKRLTSAILNNIPDPDRSRALIEAAIHDHMAYIANWSSKIQILNMASSVSTDRNTIGLTISNRVKRFISNDTFEFFQEEEIINRDEDFILFGSPGAGKTTTIKRLCRAILFLSSDSVSDRFNSVILVRCRDIAPDSSLIFHIADIIGLPGDRSAQDYSSNSKKRHELVIKISEIMKEARCFLFVDGLDECSPVIFDQVLADLENVSLRSYVKNEDKYGNTVLEQPRRYQILCTCRNGAAVTLPLGFSAIQIDALNHSEKSEIISKWSKDPLKTQSAIVDHHIDKLIDRPLFLIQVIILIDWYGYIPEKMHEIYSRLISLVVEIWDNQKGAGDSVNRISAYDRFTPGKKIDFLSSFSYYLTINDHNGSFSIQNFRDFYRLNHLEFDLPGYDIDGIIRELESHTGFIVQSGHDQYDFMHLTFQEYLSASYLVNDVASFDRIKSISKINSSVSAIVVSMSRKPGDTFARIILESIKDDYINQIHLERILERLYIETTSIGLSAELGMAIIAVMAIPNQSVVGPSGGRALEAFVDKFGLESSISLALERYKSVNEFVVTNGRRFVLSLTEKFLYENAYARTAVVDQSWLDRMHKARIFNFGSA